MAPLVGLLASDLQGAPLARGTAPAEPPGTGWGSVAGKGGLAKLASSWSAKLALVVGAGLAGVGVWWSMTRPNAPAAQPVPAVQAIAAPVVAERPLPEPMQPLSPEAVPNVAPSAEPAPQPRVARRAPARSVEAPDEFSLITQAQALRDRPVAALRVLSEHAKLYPQGALSQEREVLAVEALVNAGKLDEARARAARLEAAYPGSAHLPRVRSLLERAQHE
jgi:hypothetical protein